MSFSRRKSMYKTVIASLLLFTGILICFRAFSRLELLQSGTATSATTNNRGFHQNQETTLLKHPQVQLMTPPNDPTLFQETFCDLQNEPWYYPSSSSSSSSWQHRTPYLLLAGAKKSGTTSLSRYLAAHSQLRLPRTKELLFFQPKNFPFVTNGGAFGSKTQVAEARQYMYRRDYNAVIPLLQKKTSLYSFEASPGYVFKSTTSPKYILCTVPWVKILLILRNPVERAWSNYNFYSDFENSSRFNHTMPPFEEWIRRDMALLTRAGVISDDATATTTTTTTSGAAASVNPVAGSSSVQEYIAWDTYNRLCSEGPIGRGLYAIQLQHWYDAMKAIGRDPTQDIFVVRNEDLKRDPRGTMARIFAWLGLPQEEETEAMSIAISREHMVSRYVKGEMASDTRDMLQNFYRPYNERLYEMLGGDWHGVWEKPFDTTTREFDESSNNTTKLYVRGGRKDRDRPPPQQQEQQPNVRQWYSESETLPVVRDSFVYGKPSHESSVATAFVDQWCDLTGVNWYPRTNDDTWQLRAPYVLIPGAKKSGTTSLAFYLMQHPKVAKARTKELQFFMNKNFRAKYVRNSDRKTLVKAARRAYEREFRKPRLQNDPSLISMDATPGYLFFSSMLPQRILCTVPWVKVLIILRNPVDRVYSNYQYLVWRNHGRFKASFEMALRADIDALRRSGVLVEDGKTLTTKEEDEAWSKYLGLAGEGIVGRSLYVIQLRQWSQAIRDVGRSPETAIHVVRTEDVKKDLNGTYRKIEDFLGLPHSPITSTEPKVVNNYEPMKNETRARLEKLLDPFNRRLYDMLGGDWDGYWDP